MALSTFVHDFQVIFSSTKMVAAIAIASLVDQGLVDYDDKISSAWPEFAQNGKDSIRVTDVLRHESGLANFRTPDADSDRAVLRENVKRNAVGAVIEKLRPRFPPEDTVTGAAVRQYHAVSGGLILNELFRRANADGGRTIGEWLRQEVSLPHGVDVYIGMTDAEVARVSPLESWSAVAMATQVALPNAVGSKVQRVGQGYFDSISSIYQRGNGSREYPFQAAEVRGLPVSEA